MKPRVAVLAAILSVIAAGMASPRQASADTYPTIRLWMLPPVDNLGNGTYLSQHWHSQGLSPNGPWHAGKALDWKDNGGDDATEIVRFRALAIDLYNSNFGTDYDAMDGVLFNLPTYNCDGGIVNEGKVTIVSGSVNIKGYMIYAHTLLAGARFNIWVTSSPGATRDDGYLTSVGVGDTKPNGSGTSHLVHTDCWKGWHVHEINGIPGTYSKWDAWNSDYASYPNGTSGIVNTDPDNWIRQMTFQVTPGGG